MLHTHKAHFYRLKQIFVIFAKIHFFHHPILRACSTSYAHMRHKWYLWNKTLYIYIKAFYVIIVERREKPDIFGPISCIGGVGQMAKHKNQLADLHIVNIKFSKKQLCMPWKHYWYN